MFAQLSLSHHSTFAALKYLALRYLQATLNEPTLLAMTMSNVNHTDAFLLEQFRFVTPEEKAALKETRMKEANEYDRIFMQKYFDCTSYEEIINKMNA